MSTVNHQGKVAFVTGGNRGIGLETARQLARAGVLPVIGARSEASGEAAVGQLRDEELTADYLIFDVTNPADHQRAYDHFHASVGRLDILINNAGVYLEGETGVKDLYDAASVPEEVLRDTLEANFFAPVLLTQKLLPLLKASAAGRIVNLSSILGSLTLHRDPASPIYGANSVAYDTSKTAINAYTVHLAKVLQQSRVKVNAAHPGWVQTSMGGSSAPMSVDDGAKTSVQLALLPEGGPNGGFFHLGEALPW
ncbi:SDR family oxidoreductase [Caballeronia sp. AZ10_KS36]|uniref:SDR family oxidoreductase n=1 Tax=Caballeronia sp. AZ10_KS36 TaxID=2921757 RepID=UPI0020290F8A|nr:SDR family oxidoreductase [Caballeronia sp. AZ10_KS36]